ncbi:MAG: NAD(P)-dependent alcohol dehydrogenase [Planctomycetota bacterium]
MKTFVMKRIGEAGWMDKPLPGPTPTSAVVKTTAALVCTSDTHTLAGAIGERSNLTLGHEAVGVIHDIGEAVEGFEVGRRVAVNAITPYWFSENCQRGFPSQDGGMLGGWKFANQLDGVFAEYFLVPDAMGNLAPIPDDVADEQAVYCCDMLSTGFMGAEKAAIPIGGTVAIFAQGPVGLMATVGSRLQGAGLVIAVESVPNRRELSRRYGADLVIDYTQQDPVEAILDATDGRGVDSAIEALGRDETFQACVNATRAGGTICNIGYHGEGEFVHIPRTGWGVGMSDKTITTGLCPGGSARMKRLMRLIRTGRVDPTLMTTHRFAFDDMDTAFRMMQTKEDDIIKPLIEFK